jgi:hypothetical protein
MSEMCNDTEFRRTLESLEPLQQREVAVMFVRHVLHLCEDKRLGRVIAVAGDLEASDEELAAALKTAHAVTFDSHARCGAAGHWSEQAGYFVARAAVAAATPLSQSRAGGPAWQAAMSARMAHTVNLIDDASNTQSAHTECLWQYEALSGYLNA